MKQAQKSLIFNNLYTYLQIERLANALAHNPIVLIKEILKLSLEYPKSAQKKVRYSSKGSLAKTRSTNCQGLELERLVLQLSSCRHIKTRIVESLL
jgi:hypothetical protein